MLHTHIVALSSTEVSSSFFEQKDFSSCGASRIDFYAVKFGRVARFTVLECTGMPQARVVPMIHRAALVTLAFSTL